VIDATVIGIAIYLSFFTWIKKRDIKSNNKNDFYVPAYILIAISAMAIVVLQVGTDEERLFAVFVLIFAAPLILQLLSVGSRQDQQEARGDLTYNVGDRFWIVQTKGVTLTPDQAVFIGKEGRINEIHYEEGVKSASMTFKEDPDIRFELKSLSNVPPAAKEKGWWES
tara:strand:- start:197 stop:700 length:504 start_codon:yes stop_codon:yes gene_type:complete